MSLMGLLGQFWAVALKLMATMLAQIRPGNHFKVFITPP
jgi:hypothetical protein